MTGSVRVNRLRQGDEPAKPLIVNNVRVVRVGFDCVGRARFALPHQAFLYLFYFTLTYPDSIDDQYLTGHGSLDTVRVRQARMPYCASAA